MADLSKQFDTAMLEIYQRANTEANYTASIFHRMLMEHGGVATAKQLINATQASVGYTHLFERGFLNLTVEALVVENPNWHSLFTEAEIEKARDRLRKYGYQPQTQS